MNLQPCRSDSCDADVDAKQSVYCAACRTKMRRAMRTDGVPCECKCGCPGAVSRREQIQGLRRCLSCRQSNELTCGVRSRKGTPIRGKQLAQIKRRSRVVVDGVAQTTTETVAHVEALFRRVQQRKAIRKFHVGSAGGDGTPLAIPPTVRERP